MGVHQNPSKSGSFLSPSETNDFPIYRYLQMIFPAINLHSSGIFQSLQDDAEEAASSRVQEMMRQKPMEKPWKTMEKPWKSV